MYVLKAEHFIYDLNLLFTYSDEFCIIFLLHVLYG